MIRVEKNNVYKTFYWPCKNDVYDTERQEELKVKLFGLTIYKRNKTMIGEYFETEKRVSGFKNISGNYK